MLTAERRQGLIEQIGPLVDAFVDAGHRLYLVGGLVRDALLETAHDEPRTPTHGDIDITTDAVPDRIVELVASWAHIVWEQGKAFGTIGARRDGTTVEITTHRAEQYDRDSRKPHVRFSDSLHTDLSRRDFTVNAMAIELPGWKLHDPFGGRVDLAERRLRTPSAPAGLFSDDPLRMLRAARFCTRFELEPVPELLAAIAQTRPRLAIVSRERIATELTNLLESERPSTGVELLRSTGLLADLLPTASGGVDAIPAAALNGLDGDIALRWAVLLGPACADTAEAISCLRALRIPNSTIGSVAALLRAIDAICTAFDTSDTIGASTQQAAQLADPGTQSGESTRSPPIAHPPIARRLIARRLIVEHYAALGSARVVLAAWKRPLTDKLDALLTDVEASEGVALRHLPIDGNDVMALLGRSGPVIGQALAWLRELQITLGPISETDARERLTQWARQQPH